MYGIYINIYHALDTGMKYPDITDRIRSLVDGPNPQVSARTHMWHEGRHLRVYALDRKRKRTSDCYVQTTFSSEFRSSRHDQNAIREEVPFFGRIMHIYELTYEGFYDTILFCDWHHTQLAGQQPTIRPDPTGFWHIDTRSYMPSDRPRDEPFIYPRQVEQCMFIPSPVEEGWSYVVPYIPRSQVKLQLEEADVEVDDTIIRAT